MQWDSGENRKTPNYVMVYVFCSARKKFGL